MLNIWGRPNSINVQKVMWTVGELGLMHDRIDVGGKFGLNDEPWFRAMNPNGLVPVIDDDGLVLYESNVIVRYLALKHDKGGLTPADLGERAKAEIWMDWSRGELAEALFGPFFQLIRTPPEKRNQQIISDGAARLARLFALVEAQLEGKAYLCGDTLTIADIAVGPAVYRWLALPEIERPALANIAAYYARLSERAAFSQHVMLPLT